jgi:NAD(P)-dependent dehydrogenase (short-subunit alcohol dehydrogenase family)
MEAGGASGLGLAIVKRFAKAKAHIAILDINAEAGSRTADDLLNEGCSVTFVPCDITDQDNCNAAFKKAIGQSPNLSIDIVALVAGVIGEPGSLVDKITDARKEGHTEPPDLRHSAIDVNFIAIYNSAYLALWYMSLNTKSGKEAKKSLIFVSSTIAYVDGPLFVDYATSKGKLSIQKASPIPEHCWSEILILYSRRERPFP